MNLPKLIEMPSRRRKVDPFGAFDDGAKPAINDLTKPQIRAIACGSKHTLILAVDGSLYTFGCGLMGQLGHKNSKNVNRPKLVEAFGTKKIKLIAAGANHSIASTQQGDVYVCGHNKEGQLGLGDTNTRTCFTLLESMQEKNVYRIFAGGNHTWILLDQYVPLRVGYRYPSPLKCDDETSQSPTRADGQL